MNIFDTHAHYDDEAFNTDRDLVLRQVEAAGVSLILNPGCDIASSRKSLELANSYKNIYSAVGIHPENLNDLADDYLHLLTSFAGEAKCKAIGEIGLDYHWDVSHKNEQKEVFDAQLQLALKLDLPVVIHDRDSHADCMDIIRQYPSLRGVFHCYSGSAEMAKELLKKGWYLGFDGPVTYKNARKTIEVLEICPVDRILVETDSPYLSPVPMRGKRNQSDHLVYVIEKIAEIKESTSEKIAECSFSNGCRLFNINI